MIQLSGEKQIKNPARLFFIVAREANVAVLFRRGPSNWIQLIKWNLNKDYFEFGQWFHGRIDERKCDLNPDGSLLVYFASKYTKKQMQSAISSTWTAISKPPYFTAIGLWPNGGTTYGGGGLFIDNHTLLLNHSIIEPHPNFQAKAIKIIPHTNDVKKECKSIFSSRLDRDGWKLIQEFKKLKNKYGNDAYNKTRQPEIRERTEKKSKSIILMERSSNNDKYQAKFYLKQNEKIIEIHNGQWADWDHKGRLIAAIDGKLFASDSSDKKIKLENLKLLLDTNDHEPTLLKAPGFATRLVCLF